jgi:NADH-quinone oxidoreductase subunit G
MVEAVPHLAKIDQVPENDWQALEIDKLGSATFKNALGEFYLTNPIARASELMAELARNAKDRATTQMAAE